MKASQIMNKKLNNPKLLTLLCCALVVDLAAAGAGGGESRSAQATADQVPAAFQRLLDHQPVNSAPRQASAADPLVAHLLAAFREIRQRDAAALAAASATTPAYDSALAGFQRLLANDVERAPRAFVADAPPDPLVEHLTAALYARRGAAHPY